MLMQPTPSMFRTLWDLGYHRLCPITPPDAPVSEKSIFTKRIAAGKDPRGKAPGVKWPDGTWSGFQFVSHESTEADLVRWAAMGAGVGIKTGHGLALLDADTLNPQHADIIASVIEEELGVLPVRYGKRPKAGYLVRIEGEFQYTRVEFGERDGKGRLIDRLEVLYEGRQFVAHGTHPGTGKPYEWPNGIPELSKVPVVTVAQIMRVMDRLTNLLPQASSVILEGADIEVNQAALKGPLDVIAEAVRATPNTSDTFQSREDYLKFGYAIKAALPDDPDAAFELYADWCARWDDPEGNDPGLVEEDWARMKPPFKVGANFIYRTAEDVAGWTGRAALWFEEPIHHEPLFPPEICDDVLEKSKRFDFLTLEEAADTALTASLKPLVKGLLDQGAMSVLYGESNAGKTFVAMDLAFHIARGLPWGGMRTAGLHVVYVAAEGGRGARKRAAALMARYGGAGGRFHYLLSSVNLLRADADLEPLKMAINGLGVTVGLIVIDTLSRAMAGGDENASTDMGAMVTHLDALRMACGAHLMAVHHTGKDKAKGARGHSLLRAATDTEIEVEPGLITVTKQRDLDKEWASAFVLDVVTLGVNAEGDPVTSCTIRLVSDEEASVVSAERAGLVVGEAERAGAIALLADGSWRADSRAKDAWAGEAIAQALRLDAEEPGTREYIKALLKLWLSDGTLSKVTKWDANRNPKAFIEVASADKMSNSAFE